MMRTRTAVMIGRGDTLWISALRDGKGPGKIEGEELEMDVMRSLGGIVSFFRTHNVLQ